jgi:ATP-binding cassette, subfamily B, multidrug efflux pump
VGKGTHKELMENCPVYQELALSQLSREELG